MQLTILGSNGTYPTAGRPASGYLVDHSGTTLWMDAGPGTYAALCMETDPAELDAVLLSHRHPDHCVDLFALFHRVAYGPSLGNAIPVIVPSGLADRLCAFVGDSAEDMRRVFEFRTVSEGDTIEIGSLSISIAAANHPPPTIAPRITGGGKILGYTADTGPSASLAAHFGGSDLLLAEASLSDPRDSDAYPFHLTGAEAGALAAEAGVRTLMLTHIAPTLDPNRVVAAAEAEFEGTVTIAVPGARVTV